MSNDQGKCKNKVKHGFFDKRINPTNLGIFPRSFGIFMVENDFFRQKMAKKWSKIAIFGEN